MNENYKDREYNKNPDIWKESFKEYEQEGKMPYLPVEEMKPFYLYKIHARNSNFGIWHPKRKVFVISRFKFKDNFLCQELHWDTDKHHGTAKPLKELEKTPFEMDDFKDKKRIKVKEYLNTYDKIKCPECGRHKDEWVVHESWCSERTKVF